MGDVRKAGPGDLDTLLELCRRYCQVDDHVFEAETARSGFAPLLESDEHGVVWVVERSGRMVGYAVVTWSWSIESGGRDALLDEVYVEPSGEGLGSVLVAQVMEDCRRRGLPRIFLETERANHDARRFYQKLGFAAEDSVWMVKVV